MATQILTHSSQSNHYSIKEFQLLVKDAPVVPAEIQPFVGVSFRSSADIYRLFKGLSEMPVESFLVVHLDGKNRMVGMTTSSIGSMTSSLVHPRDVFRPAIANMTAGLIFIHNHPSGDPAPSQEDLQITKRLCEVGKLIGIKCLDHIIIGQGRYFSFADQGCLLGGND
ncbi:DNA repair protein RadC [Acidobacteria bacterium AH-259-L09]|nr:DNA repair protein RadC [Acidobacteria bacterium AH-259-L09]